ncbi:hypothetical protein JKP88DRAFT_309997 [Tribonema minus]|uniref:Uncharacterized protein n=1 Tax=Tribonema minus TaxID=303371 RepID=A0A835Z2J3_9STRA|nr:hypothetical protein JKP88DRAFT_309997 [Tribonema minus]
MPRCFLAAAAAAAKAAAAAVMAAAAAATAAAAAAAAAAPALAAQIQLATFPALFWEAAPVSGDTAAHAPFEFVTGNAPALAGEAAALQPFWAHVRASRERAAVSTFASLQGDAILISPCKARGTSRDAYSSLTNFFSDAPAVQIFKFWRATAEAMQSQLAVTPAKPFWLSAAASQRCWVHARVDSAPKHVKYAPHKQWDADVGGRHRARLAPIHYNTNRRRTIDTKAKAQD